MAQQVEHVLGKDEVTGSNPVSSSIAEARRVLQESNPLRVAFLLLTPASAFSRKSHGFARGLHILKD